MIACQFCGKEFTTNKAMKAHSKLCPKNPDRNSQLYLTRKKVTPWNKGKTKDTDEKIGNAAKKTSVTMKGRPSNCPWTEEQRAQKSEWRKQYHKDHPEEHPNRKLSGNRSKMSYPEQVAYDFLIQTGIEFEHNLKVGRYYPDFVIGNTIIEIDGARWHNKENDDIRDAELSKCGYTVCRIDTRQHIETEIQKILLAVAQRKSASFGN